MKRFSVLLGGALFLVACDRFWHLTVQATTSPRVTIGCVDTAVQRLTGLPTTLAGNDVTHFPTQLVNLGAGPYGAVVVLARTPGDSTRLAMLGDWVGREPSADTVAVLIAEYSRILTGLSRTCAGADPTISVRRPE